MNINEHQWTSLNITEYQWTSMNINEHQWTSMTEGFMNLLCHMLMLLGDDKEVWGDAMWNGMPGMANMAGPAHHPTPHRLTTSLTLLALSTVTCQDLRAEKVVKQGRSVRKDEEVIPAMLKIAETFTRHVEQKTTRQWWIKEGPWNAYKSVVASQAPRHQL